jgi:hypothetical protein
MKDGWWPAIIASAVSSGAVGLVYFLIRRMIEDMSRSVNDKFEKVWTAFDNLKESHTKDRLVPSELQKRVDENVTLINKKIDQIKLDYMPRETHALMCGKAALEMEKMLTRCLKKFEDNIFKKINKTDHNF